MALQEKATLPEEMKMAVEEFESEKKFDFHRKLASENWKQKER